MSERPSPKTKGKKPNPAPRKKSETNIFAIELFAQHILSLTLGHFRSGALVSTMRTAMLPIVEQVQAALNQSLLTEEEKGKK